jgi:hypothetical protein
MLKIFISQPMREKTDEQIQSERQYIESQIPDLIAHEDYTIIESFFPNYSGNAVESLGRAIQALSEADIAVFAPNWHRARGCRMEHLICKEYGIRIADLPEQV